MDIYTRFLLYSLAIPFSDGLLSHQSTLFDQVFSSTADVPNRDSEDHL